MEMVSNECNSTEKTIDESLEEKDIWGFEGPLHDFVLQVTK